MSAVKGPPHLPSSGGMSVENDDEITDINDKFFVDKARKLDMIPPFLRNFFEINYTYFF